MSEKRALSGANRALSRAEAARCRARAGSNESAQTRARATLVRASGGTAPRNHPSFAKEPSLASGWGARRRRRGAFGAGPNRFGTRRGSPSRAERPPKRAMGGRDRGRAAASSCWCRRRGRCAQRSKRSWGGREPASAVMILTPVEGAVSFHRKCVLVLRRGRGRESQLLRRDRRFAKRTPDWLALPSWRGKTISPSRLPTSPRASGTTARAEANMPITLNASPVTVSRAAPRRSAPARTARAPAAVRASADPETPEVRDARERRARHRRLGAATISVTLAVPLRARHGGRVRQPRGSRARRASRCAGASPDARDLLPEKKEAAGREKCAEWGIDVSDVEQGNWGRICECQAGGHSTRRGDAQVPSRRRAEPPVGWSRTGGPSVDRPMT